MSQRAMTLVEKLLHEPEVFSFGQVMRILGLVHARAYGGLDAFFQHGVTVIPHLSLGFPPSDVILITEKPFQTRATTAALQKDSDTEETTDTLLSEERLQYTVTASFMGLYGASAPLPTFYTEELLDDQRRDSTVARDFLDMFNQILYRKYYQAHTIPKLALRAEEQQDTAVRDLQYCLLGTGHEALRELQQLTRGDLGCINLLARHTRSALGLEDMVRLCLAIEDVEVEQCVERTVIIPEDQRCRPGLANAALGQDAVLGSTIPDCTGKFRIHINGLTRERFELLQPGRALRTALEHGISLYLNDPLEYDLVLSLAPGAFAPAQLGTPRWAILGVNTFLLAPEATSPATSIRLDTPSPLQ